MDPVKSLKILELGTGNEELIRMLKEHKVIGIDINPSKELLDKGYKIIKHDLNYGLKFKNNEFDCIFALEVLEHLYNPFYMMSEIKRVLKKGGFLIASLPNSRGFFARIGKLYEKEQDKLDIYWHHYEPGPKSIRHLISSELKIEKEVLILTFKRSRLMNLLFKPLLKVNPYFFCGCLMIKARKY